MAEEAKLVKAFVAGRIAALANSTNESAVRAKLANLRRGIGKALFERFAWLMQQQRRQTMIVWVAEKNPSTGFYAARGGELADRKTLTVCGVPVPVLGYRYKLEELSG